MMWKKRQLNKRKTFGNKEQWYDLIEDWELIEASFTAQYGIRLRSENDMSWAEFSTLLAGIMPKTPLGQIVSIRSEEDRDMLKSFTPEQHEIRNEWRDKQFKELEENTTNEDKENKIKELQEIFAKAFS